MKPATRRAVIVLAICAVCTVLFLVLWAKGFIPLQQMEFFAQDWQARLGRKTPVDDRLVLIGIDKPIYAADFSDEELQREPVLKNLQSDWPWSRAVWARLIEKLADAGAKVIVFDLVFASEREGDDQLHRALDKYPDRVVIGYQISATSTDRGDQRELQVPNPSIVVHSETNSIVEDDRLGFADFWPDFDDTMRRVNFRLTGGDPHVGHLVADEIVLESLDARVLRKFGRPDLIPPGFDSRLFRYTSPAGQSYTPIPVGFVLSPKLWENTYHNGKDFAGKIVLIGPTMEILHDVHNTPFTDPRAMAGPEIHLQVINAALHGEFLGEPSLIACLFITAMSGIIAGALCLLIQQPFKRLLIVFGVTAAYWILSLAVLNQTHTNEVMHLVPPTLVFILSGLVVFSYDFIVERLERMKLRHTMGLYFSPRVMEAVLANPGSMEPRRADVTLLLTDLRNSTPLAEALGPQGMFELLNRVFEAQTNAIMGEEGNLEHFLGDQFLSYWGAPQPQADAADRAGRAAIKLITAMESLRPTLTPQVQKLFGYGVALHSGGVLVGNKGSAQRLDYGLVGDTVNEAARVEALTKYYGARLLVTSVTFGQLTTKTQHRFVDRVIVKGKSEPVELFECENPCTPANYPDICARYKLAYDEYTAGHFAEAQAQFDALIKEFSDGPSKALSARCAGLLAHPPAAWKGIWKMDAK